MAENTTIRTRDGAKLAGTFYAPESPVGVAALINGATGVPRGFYDAFAKHLAGRGIGVLTYDYRGIGGSNDVDGEMEDWGAIDQPAALECLAALRPQDSLALVGHSFGGQVLGLAPNIDRVKAAFFVAAQSGYWRHWPWPLRARMWLLWWVLMPGLTSIVGHFPGHWIGTARLPAKIALNWARWGRSPHYVSDRTGAPLRPFNDRVRFPIRWLSFTDDSIAPFGAVEALRDYYPLARPERLHMAPSDIGAASIGHFGFFRKNFPQGEWNKAAHWMIEATKTQRA